jgi:hypothetical protein
MLDLTLICRDCGRELVWTEGEQEFYAQKGLEQPIYCLICRGKYKARQRDPGADAKRSNNTD